MKLISPIVTTKHEVLLICEPNSKFICPFCNHKETCIGNTEYSYSSCYENSFVCLEDYNESYFDKVFKTLLRFKFVNLKGVVFAISEQSLVENRKELYKLSKAIFEHDKYLSQYLFTNTEFCDLLELKTAYKYLTYIDYIIQNKNPHMNSDNIFDCIFNNAICIQLTKSFTEGKAFYTNF